MSEWVSVNDQLPPNNAVVETKIDDEQGERQVQDLMRKGNLMFFPDESMYIYYVPTHWRIRSFDLDPDFRRLPKTEHFCCMCQRDIDPKQGKGIRVDREHSVRAIHPNHANNKNSYLAIVGNDCAKRIPKEFLVNSPTKGTR